MRCAAIKSALAQLGQIAMLVERNINLPSVVEIRASLKGQSKCVAASPQPSSLVTSVVRWNFDRDLPKYTPRFNVALGLPPTFPSLSGASAAGSAGSCTGVDFALGRRSSIDNRMINSRLF